MNYLSNRMRRFGCFILSLIFLIVLLPARSILADTSDVRFYSVEDGEQFETSCQIVSSWGNHANIELKVKNTGNTVIDNWYLSFQTQYHIENIWNARIVEDAGYGTYTIKNSNYNQDIYPNSEVTIGITVSFIGNAPSNFSDWYLLNTKTKQVESSKYSVYFQQYSNWGSGYNGVLILSASTQIEDWALSFDTNYSIPSQLLPRPFYPVYLNIQGTPSSRSFGLRNVTMTSKTLAFSLFDDENNNGVPDYWDFIVSKDGQDPVIPTVTPTPVTTAPTSTPTDEPTVTPSVTEVPTETPTSVPTVTIVPTVTEVPTETPTSVPTVTEVPTPTDEPTVTPPITEAPTETPTSVPTVTEVPTDIPTSIPTVTEVPTPTDEPTVTPPITEAPTPTTTVIPTPTVDIAMLKDQIVCWENEKCFHAMSGSEELIYYVEVPDESLISSIELYDSNNNLLGTFADDGYNGDLVAGDNIFSCKTGINTDIEEYIEEVHYQITISTTDLQSFSVTKICVISSDDDDIFVMNTIDAYLSEYEETGFEADSIETRKETYWNILNNLVDIGLIKPDSVYHSSINDVIFYEDINGFSCFVYYGNDNYPGTASDTSTQNISVSEKLLKTNQSIRDTEPAEIVWLYDYGPFDNDSNETLIYLKQWCKNVNNVIFDEIPNVYSYANLLDDSTSLVIISAHGLDADMNRCVLFTDSFNININVQVETLKSIKNTYGKDVLIRGGNKINYVDVYIESSFITNNYSSDAFSGKTILLDSCFSAGNMYYTFDNFPKAFFACGASNVIAYRNPTLICYLASFNRDFCEYFFDGTHSCKEAYDHAVEINGEDDCEKDEFKNIKRDVEYPVPGKAYFFSSSDYVPTPTPTPNPYNTSDKPVDVFFMCESSIYMPDDCVNAYAGFIDLVFSQGLYYYGRDHVGLGISEAGTHCTGYSIEGGGYYQNYLNLLINQNKVTSNSNLYIDWFLYCYWTPYDGWQEKWYDERPSTYSCTDFVFFISGNAETYIYDEACAQETLTWLKQYNVKVYLVVLDSTKIDQDVYDFARATGGDVLEPNSVTIWNQIVADMN